MNRRAFLKTGAGVLVPVIGVSAAIPMQLGDTAFLGRKHASAAAVISPLTDPNILAFWSTDTTLYRDGSDQVRCDSLSAPRGWYSRTDATGATWALTVNGVCNGPLITDNDINGHPSLTFNSVYSFLSNATSHNQPYTVYLLAKVTSFTVASPPARLFDSPLGGAQTYGGLCLPVTGTGALEMRAAAGGPPVGPPSTTDLALNTWGIITCIFDGASSSVQIDNGTVHTGDPGSFNALGGIIFGAGGDLIASTGAKFKMAAAVVTSVHSSSTWLANNKNWLADYGGLSI